MGRLFPPNRLYNIVAVGCRTRREEPDGIAIIRAAMERRPTDMEERNSLKRAIMRIDKNNEKTILCLTKHFIL